MDYIDDDAVRPRFQFHSSATSSSTQSSSSALHRRRPINKLHLSLCSLASLLLLFLTFLSAKIPSPFFDNPVFRLLLLWTALSLLIAPFAPLSVTGGEISVGKGDPLPDDNHDDDEDNSNYSLKDNESSRKRSSLRQRRINSTPPLPPPEVVSIAPQPKIGKGEEEEDRRKIEDEGSSEKEWTLEDFELLKKTVAKNPPGIRGRWENVAEAFKGKIKRERVIAAAKVIGTVKPAKGEDSFTAFLRQVRKEEEGDHNGNNGEGEKEHWSAAEDLALLNALKIFTKETAMRWEKVAEAVPGKSKGSCIKRFGELKKDFRSSKESS